MNWIPREDGSGTLPRGVAYGNSEFVEVDEAVGQASGSGIQHSTDGLNWVDSQASWSGILLNSIAYGNGYFVAVGGGQEYFVGGDWFVHRPAPILISADGVTWVQRQSGTETGLSAIAYGNGHFVAVGTGGTILQSGSIITLAITPNAGTGLLTLSLEGPTGLAYTIETSTDLGSWQTLTNLTSVQPTTVIFDALPVASDHMFYLAYSQ